MLRRESKRVRRRESEAWRKRLRYDVRSIDDANMVYVCMYRFEDESEMGLV